MDVILPGVALGVVAGFLAGMFGVDGSTVLTPLLRTVLGLPPLVTLGTPLPVVIPTAISGVLAIGAVAGFFAGLLAVGGGFILVPAYFLRFDIKRAIATSLAAILLLAVPGSIAHFLLGNVDLLLSLGLATGSVPMAYAGASVAIRLRSALLKRLFAALLVAFAVFFFYSQL